MEREILSKYKKQEDKLLISKIMDKIEFCKQRKTVETTDFLDLAEQKMVENFLQSQKITNYKLTGGKEDLERKIIIFYPDKLQTIFEKNSFNLNTVFSVLKIAIPSELQGQYDHRMYLGGLMKLGIKREKIGDILVDEKGCDILIKPEIEKFITTNITELTRFSKSKIMTISLEEIREKVQQKEELKITIPSMRLDSIVSELVHCARNKAAQIIEQERVFVNFEVVTKTSKEVKEKDILTIRGKGRFEIGNIVGNTKKERIILLVQKY